MTTSKAGRSGSDVNNCDVYISIVYIFNLFCLEFASIVVDNLFVDILF